MRRSQFYALRALYDPLVVYYHIVADRYVPHVSSLYSFKTRDEFVDDIRWLQEHFRPISLEELQELHVDDEKPFRGKRPFHVTFDDGFSEVVDTALPILSDLKVPATIFMCSSTLNNYSMLHEQKRALILDCVEERKNDSEIREVENLLNACVGKHPHGAGNLRGRIEALTYSNRDLLDRIGETLRLNWVQYLSEYSPYLTGQQVQGLLAEGFSIGSHTRDHADFRYVARHIQVEEVESDALHVASFATHRSPVAFSFPYSDAYCQDSVVSEILGRGRVEILLGNSRRGVASRRHVIRRLNLERHRGPIGNAVFWHLAKTLVP